MMPRAFVFVFLAGCATVASAGTTLDRIRETKILRCAINQETPEYSTSDDHGPRIAFDADLCRAVAIAVAGPTANILAVAVSDDVLAMEAIRGRQADMSPSLTLDLTHASDTVFTFTPPVLYDSIGIMVPIAGHLTRAAELNGKKICFLAETEVEVALRNWFVKQRLKFVPFPFQEEGEMEAAFVTGNCAAISGDLTRLAAERLGFGPLADRYALLPDQIAQDPLAAATLSDDPSFAAIVYWTFQALVHAEALGLTQKSIGAEDDDSNPAVAVLTGQTHEIGTRLSLPNDWATRVIAAVGNYGEIYVRDLGDQSTLKLPRGLNRLYTEGGLMYPVPLK